MIKNIFELIVDIIRCILLVVNVFVILLFVPIGWIYGAARRGFKKGCIIGEDPMIIL